MIRPLAALVAAALPVLVWTPSVPAQNASTPPREAEPAAAPEAEPMTAERVLEKMAEAYRACSTYQDEGEVAIKFDTERGTRTDRRPFKTAFVRPDKFIYEFTDSPGIGNRGARAKYVVWSDGEQIRSWWTIRPQVERHDSMLAALSGPTGVSGGSAITVPAMLYDMQGVGVRRSTRITQPKLAGEDEVDGAMCLRVEGRDSIGEPVTIWVDKELFLIRKIYEEQAFDDFTTQTTTTYKPKVGEVIPDETFSFTPPGEKK